MVYVLYVKDSYSWVVIWELMHVVAGAEQQATKYVLLNYRPIYHWCFLRCSRWWWRKMVNCKRREQSRRIGASTSEQGECECNQDNHNTVNARALSRNTLYISLRSLSLTLIADRCVGHTISKMCCGFFLYLFALWYFRTKMYEILVLVYVVFFALSVLQTSHAHETWSCLYGKKYAHDFY